MDVTDMDAEPQPRAEELVRLGARVRQLRLARSLTQQQLADAIDVHRVNLNRFENGRSDLGVSRVRALAKALDVAPDSLFEG